MTLYAVGKIVGCFGIRGDVKIRPATHSTRRLTSLQTVMLGFSPEEVQDYVVEHVEVRDRFTLMRFKNVCSRTDAEALIDRFVFVGEHDVEMPQKGSYFTHEIIGCKVYSTEQRFLGTVEDVYRLPAQDIWTVRDGSKVHMIPAVKEFIQEVNLEKRTIVIQVIEGLIDG